MQHADAIAKREKRFFVLFFFEQILFLPLVARFSAKNRWVKDSSGGAIQSG
jgi:hypothetical protein